MKHEYTVAVNGEIEPDLVLASKREARQTVSDWKTLSKWHGYEDRFQIMVREVGPWRKLEERKGMDLPARVGFPKRRKKKS